MGSSDADMAALGNEKPQHKVHLDTYLIGKHEITVAQFEAFVSATGYKATAQIRGAGRDFTGTGWIDVPGADWQHPHGQGSNVSGKQDHPVTQISWDDAMSFCQWLSRVTGRNVQLPTEAQWEKAARNGWAYLPLGQRVGCQETQQP